jgi:hypothetical protein
MKSVLKTKSVLIFALIVTAPSVAGAGAGFEDFVQSRGRCYARLASTGGQESDRSGRRDAGR